MLPSNIGLRALLGVEAKLAAFAQADEYSTSSEVKSFISEFSLVGRIVLHGMLGSEDGPMPEQNGVEAIRAAAAKLPVVKAV